MPPMDASEKFLDDIHRLRECLQAAFFLDRLKMTELENLMSVMKKQHFPPGFTVFKQGEKGETFYLVSQGRLSFSVRKGPLNEKTTELHPKDYFGETALISDEPRSATIKTLTDCDVFLLNKRDFKEILMANPWIAEEIRHHMREKKMENQ